MPSNVTDEIDTHTAGSLVVEITIETQRAKMALKFATEQGRGLAATGVTSPLRAEEDEVFVGTGAGCEGRGRRWLILHRELREIGNKSVASRRRKWCGICGGIVDML